jgi:hypothetical protein
MTAQGPVASNSIEPACPAKSAMPPFGTGDETSSSSAMSATPESRIEIGIVPSATVGRCGLLASPSA